MQRYNILKPCCQTVADSKRNKFLFNIYLTFFGAKKEAKKHSPHQASPQGEDVTENRGNRRFSGFWYGSQAFAPSGFAMVLIGWRIEKAPNKGALEIGAFGESSDKEAILKGPLDPGARAGDRYSSPHRCNGLPEAAASEPWARSLWHRGYAAGLRDSD